MISDTSTLKTYVLELLWKLAELRRLTEASELLDRMFCHTSLENSYNQMADLSFHGKVSATSGIQPRLLLRSVAAVQHIDEHLLGANFGSKPQSLSTAASWLQNLELI